MATIDDVYALASSIKSEMDTLYTVDTGGKVVSLYHTLVVRDLDNGFDNILNAMGGQTGQFNNINNNIFAVNDNLAGILSSESDSILSAIGTLTGTPETGPAPDLSAVAAAISAISSAITGVQSSVTGLPSATADSVTSHVNWLALAGGVVDVAAAVLSPEIGLAELALGLGGISAIASSIDTKVDALGDGGAGEFDPVPALGWTRLSQALVDIWQQASDANSNTVDIKNTLVALGQLHLDISTLRTEVAHITDQVDAMRADLSTIRPRVVHNMPKASELLLTASHVMGDTGTVNTSSGTVAVSIEFSTIPAGVTRDKGVVPDFKGLGIAAYGNSKGWARFVRLERTSNFFLLQNGFDRVTWAVRPALGGTLREFGSSEG